MRLAFTGQAKLATLSHAIWGRGETRMGGQEASGAQADETGLGRRMEPSEESRRDLREHEPAHELHR